MKKHITTVVAIVFTSAFFLFMSFIALGQNVAVNITGTPAAATNMFEVTQTNTAANMVAIYAIHSGAVGGGLTGYGLQAIKTGASAGTNVAGYFSATGGANNYAIIVPSGGGNVGVGTSVPAANFEVDGSSGSTIKIVDGNQGAGKVLTDVAGTGQGSWQAVASTAPTLHIQTYSTSGTYTWTVPSGVTSAWVTLCGGGGAGAYLGGGVGPGTGFAEGQGGGGGASSLGSGGSGGTGGTGAGGGGSCACGVVCCGDTGVGGAGGDGIVIIEWWQ